MTNQEKAREHAARAEELLDVKKERFTGKERITVEAATHAGAHATLALFYRDLKEEEA